MLLKVRQAHFHEYTGRPGVVHFQVRRLNLPTKEILIDEFLELNGPQKGAASGEVQPWLKGV